MRCSMEDLDKALAENKILPYEQELVERLRNVSFHTIPVSIIILSKPLCRKECYAMSMNLTRGMDHFKLVHGDVNFLSKNDDYPNHSWVERNGWVYDTTDGFRWDKDLYYELFQPEVREIYDENSVKDYADYQWLLSKCEEDKPIATKALMIQYIELLDRETPYINTNYLLNEIEVWRTSNNVTKKYSDEEMNKYQKIVKSFMEEHHKKV